MELLKGIQAVLEESAMLRLFVIVAVGYLLGEIRFPGNFRFGLVAVLLVGLGFGAISPAFALPLELQTLGLVLFVYCVGLEVAPGFLARLKRDGLRLNAAAAFALLMAFLGCLLFIRLSGQPKELIAGLFCGALTNTPALAAVTESVDRYGGDASSAVIGYALAYPVAVVGLLLLMQFRVSRMRTPAVAKTVESASARTFHISNHAPDGKPWTVASVRAATGLILTRCKLPGGEVQLAGSGDLELPPDSRVVAVGRPPQMELAEQVLGPAVSNMVEPELGGLESHRYFVSNPAVVGRRLEGLNLISIGTIVSRIRRGDTDIPVTPDTILLLGDRVRALSTPADEPAVRKYFGNSIHMLTETGYITFALGISLGLLLGIVPIPIPGVAHPVSLGAAGGPLIVALILGARGRTGPLIWSLPFTVNLALRQLGLLLFFAGVGVRAGGGLSTFTGGNGPMLVALGFSIMLFSHLILWAVLSRFKPTLEQVFGATSALQTQPAALSFAEKQVPSSTDLNAAYAAIFPLATILKIILAQLLLL